MKLEHSGGVKEMTDEQIEEAIEAIQTMIEGEAEVVPSLPAPGRMPKA